MKTWSKEETRLLLENYSLVGNEELYRLIPNKSRLGIYKKARSLGLYKCEEVKFINRSRAKKGERSSNWHGGIAYASKGHKLIKMPEHHRADANGYVLEHILVWEKLNGVPVPDGFCIHHINENKTDNRPENLMLLTWAGHTRLHNYGRVNSEEVRQRMSIAAKNRKKRVG